MMRQPVITGKPLISVIIVNYNGAGVLDSCIRSLRSQRYRPIEVIVVDNGSADGSVEMVRSKYPEVRLVMSGENLGFAGGNNRGLKEARGEYVALLNNDTVVDENWLQPLLTLAQLPGVGIACSKVITESTPPEFYEMNGTINYLGYNIMMVFRDLSQVFFASGASLLFRREGIDRLFPEEYFIYHEDVYLSWKVRLSGCIVAMAQNSIVHHRGRTTSKQQTPATVTFYQERNRVLNCLMFYESRTLLLLTPYLIADALAKLFVCALGRGKSVVGLGRAYLWLLTHVAWIKGERSKLQGSRKVHDAFIMSLMSPDVVDSNKAWGRAINRISRLYADTVRLAHYG